LARRRIADVYCTTLGSFCSFAVEARDVGYWQRILSSQWVLFQNGSTGIYPMLCEEIRSYALE